MDFCAARERIHGLSIDPLFYYAAPFLRLLWVLLLFLLLAQATVGTLVICYVFSYPGKIKKTTRQKRQKDKKTKRQKESFILWSQDSLHFSDVFFWSLPDSTWTMQQSAIFCTTFEPLPPMNHNILFSYFKFIMTSTNHPYAC